MKHRHRRALLVGALVATSIPLVPQARAQDPGAVTLRVSRKAVTFGEATVLSGKVSPATSGQVVTIIDENDRTVAKTTTSSNSGAFSVTLMPRNNLVLRARSLAATSARVWLRVRPILQVSAGRARLFDKVPVRGSLRPAQPGERVRVSLMSAGREVSSRTAPLKKGMWIDSKLYVRKPGTYRVRVAFVDDDHMRASRWADAGATALPSLGIGSSGEYVKALERRLRRLNYYLPGADSRFDVRTADALRAFNKVQGRARLGTVDASTWRALSSPKIPKPRARGPRFHFEVDQTKQVLYTVFEGKVTNVLHVSTGAGYATRDGVFHVYRKLAGYSGNRLYYPSYWDGLRAFHGWPEVPTYNASHGCVRVPMWAATWVYDMAPIGSEVRIYH